MIEVESKREVFRLLFNRIRQDTLWEHRSTRKVARILKVLRSDGTVLLQDDDRHLSVMFIVDFRDSYARQSRTKA
jgi:hypothetical protein